MAYGMVSKMAAEELNTLPYICMKLRMRQKSDFQGWKDQAAKDQVAKNQAVQKARISMMAVEELDEELGDVLYTCMKLSMRWDALEQVYDVPYIHMNIHMYLNM